MEIRVVVASEVRLYREGLLRVLQGAAGVVLVGIASSAEDVVEQTSRLMPTVVLLDLAMARALSTLRCFVQAPRVKGVVILGIPEAYADIVSCLPAGIVRLVKPDGTVADLINAIRAAGGGETCAETVTHEVGLNALTAREKEILQLMQRGLCNKTISRQLGIELSTVKNHVHSVLTKLGVHSRSEAISLLFRHGQPEPEWGATLLGDGSAIA
jgi:two-component system, NarL family, nitrate/nitrite response regulator NarL